MRISWLSNAPWAPSGYGEQTALFCRQLRGLGHEMSIVCNYGLQDMITTWDGFDVYPAIPGDWGDQTIETYAEDANAELVIALCDAWVLHPDQWPDLTMAIWAPVDHYPIPPIVLASLAQPNVRPIAMSRFGVQQMRDCNLDPLYVPHGYDPAIFKPEPELRDTIRGHLGIPPGAFLAGMVAANRSKVVHRKAFPQAMHAFANLLKTGKDAYLYVHTDPCVGGGDGMDLVKLRTMLGIPDDRIKFPSDKARRMGVGADVMARLYGAFDVLLMPSMGEGFGIPLIQAQACGCPVITSEHSAMTELGEVGWLVAGDPWWDPPAESFFQVPYIPGIQAALEAAYETRGDQRLRSAAVEFAAPYNADLITREHWVPTLEQLGARPESRQVRRARERREAKRKVAA